MNNPTSSTSSWQPTIKLQDFEGPLDLLLHLIREAKMDIYDIQIAKITSQYMAYLHQMKAHQLEVAGEYFVMAATLMKIKSRLLLPQAPPLEEEPVEEPEDPRQELVEQLLEYQRYKKAAAKLKDKENHRQQEYTRPAMKVPAEMMVREQTAPGVSITQLQRAFRQVLRRHYLAQPQVETIETERVSVAQRMKTVFQQVSSGPVRFDDLFEGKQTRDALVTTFLAVLELAKHQAVLLDQAQLFAPIVLMEGPKSEEYRSNQPRTN